MNEKADSVPILDLAPKQARSLSFWNPLDYFILFYWAFFFPQAIRWYVEHSVLTYWEEEGRARVWDGFRNNRAQSVLVAQGLATIIFFATGTALLLKAFGAPVSWPAFIFGVVVGVAVGIAVGVAGGVALGVAVGITFGVTSSITFGIAFGIAGNVPFGVAFGISFGVAVGAAFGVALGVAVGVAGGIAAGVAGSAAFGAAIGAASGVAFGIAIGVTGGVYFGVAFGFVFPISVLLSVGRLLDWVLFLPAGPPFSHYVWSRMVWLQLFGAKRQISDWLDRDWALGVRNINQILAYTLQFIPAVAAVNETLARSSASEILRRAAILAEHPYDWDLLRFGSSPLKNRLVEAAIDGLFWIPSRWRQTWQAKYPSYLRLDTPARSACAGFWLWHSREPGRAEKAFEHVRDIPFGPELYGIAQAIATASEVSDLAALVRWRSRVNWLQELPEEKLRPGALNAIALLRTVSEEASVAYRAAAPLNRSAALGRAAAELDRLATTAEQVSPYPEWPLLQGIATAWLKIIVEAAGVAGEEVLREPVLNPYEGYSGLPVTGVTFIGRLDIFEAIETIWASGGVLPVLFLYGHRRMGKTSILRKLEQEAPRGMLLVYLDMQDSAWVDHTGELLLDLAEGVYRRAVQAGLDAGPPPEEIRYERHGDARRELNSLLKRLDPQMEGRRIILAIDEFERIEKAVADGRVDAGVLDYLRALNQRHRWLALVFGGLHTLDEMGRDYQNAFFGQAEHVRVGYLSREDTECLVTQPHPDFALEYALELRDELYRLTFGQPFLLQRICWEMVNRWNERFLKEGEKTPRTLTLADLEPVLDHDLYAGAAYYFDGVWSNVTEEERWAMTTMAGREEAWAIPDLGAALGATVEEVGRIIALLKRHDVIVEEASGIRFASELMRRWVVRSDLSH